MLTIGRRAEEAGYSVDLGNYLGHAKTSAFRGLCLSIRNGWKLAFVL